MAGPSASSAASASACTMTEHERIISGRPYVHSRTVCLHFRTHQLTLGGQDKSLACTTNIQDSQDI
eukprot:5175946-Prorocentrum_lima.AAC.1